MCDIGCLWKHKQANVNLSFTIVLCQLRKSVINKVPYFGGHCVLHDSEPGQWENYFPFKGSGKKLQALPLNQEGRASGQSLHLTTVHTGPIRLVMTRVGETGLTFTVTAVSKQVIWADGGAARHALKPRLRIILTEGQSVNMGCITNPSSITTCEWTWSFSPLRCSPDQRTCLKKSP